MSIGMYYHFNQSFYNFACNNTFIHISTASLYRASSMEFINFIKVLSKSLITNRVDFKFYNGWFGLNSLLYTNAFGVSIQNSFDFKRNANQIYPPPPLFLEKNREIFFFNRIHLLLKYIRYDYVCKSSTFANVIFKGKCLQNNCHNHYM